MIQTVLKKAKDAFRKAYRPLESGCSRLLDSIENKSPIPLPKGERGFFGGIVTALVIVALFVITLLMLGGLQLIVKKIAQGVHLGYILVHIPQIQISGMTVGSAGSTPNFVMAAGETVASLYSTFRLVAFLVVTIGFVCIGLSYALEQFNIVLSGMAEKMLSESVLIIILIFIFPYFFNASAAALNGLNEDIILSPPKEQIKDMNPGCADALKSGNKEPLECVSAEIAEAAGTVPEGVLGGLKAPGLPIGGLKAADPSRIIVTLVTMTASFISVIIAFAVGIFKILATTAFAAAFPLILSLRLIPVLREVSQRLTSALIGLMLAGIIIALFFRIGFGILHEGLSWTFTWAVGVGVLLASAGAFTITAPALSGMSGMISGTLGRTMSGAIGGMVAAGGTAGLAGVAGAGAGGMQLAKSGKLSGMSKMGQMGSLGKTMGKSGLRGVAGGGPGSDIGASIAGGASAGKESGLKEVARGQGAGQQAQTTQAWTQEMKDTMNNLENADPATIESEAELGDAHMKAMKGRGMKPKEAYQMHGNVLSRGSRRDVTDKDLEAMEKKGDIDANEINEAAKHSVANYKDSKKYKYAGPSEKEKQDKMLKAALHRISKNGDRR